jgi:magnesium chelatase accessory protein
MQYSLNWQRDGNDWPNRAASRFVRAAGMRWHVQFIGQGPPLLLLHGTGASTHSYGALAPLLARDFMVVIPDLPGHGFTQAPPRELLSLPGMSRAISALLRELGLQPEIAVGHSAGAAVIIYMTIARLIAPRAIISLNGALLPLSGLAGHMFAPLAKLLVRMPFVSDIFARRARHPDAIQRLVDQTGSKLDPRGVEFYRRLAGSPGHVEAALGMMANWDLNSFSAELPRLKTPLTLVVGSRDRTIPPQDAARTRAFLPKAQIVTLNGLGHLAHEERPDEVAAVIRDAALAAGVLPREDG